MALTVLALAVVGCGSTEPVGHGEAGACAAAVVYHDAMYVRVDKRQPWRPLKKHLDGGYAPACNDHEGSPGADQPVDLRRIASVPPSEAVYSRRPFPGVYRRTGAQP